MPTVSRIDPQIPPVLQTRCRGAAPSLTGDVDGSGVRKVLEAKATPRPSSTLQKTRSPFDTSNESAQSAQSHIPLELPNHQEGKYTIVSERRRTVCQHPNESADQNLDQVLARDTNKSTRVRPLTSPNLGSFHPAVTPPVFSKRLAEPLERWLETVARAGMWNVSSIHLALPVSISDRKATDFDAKGRLRTSISEGGSFEVPSGVQAVYKGAPMTTSEEGSREEHCTVLDFKKRLMPPASPAYGNPHTTTKRGIALLDKTDRSQSKGTGRSSSLDHVLPLSVHGIFATQEDLFDLLTHTVYSALYFDPSGSFRKCGSDQATRCPATSRNSENPPTTPRKRRLEREPDRDRESNQDNGDDRQSGKTKRSRVSNGKLGRIERRFACLHCKRDLSYGDDASLKCAGWSSADIDNVLRRHLKKHVPCGHISETKYRQVRALMKEYSHTDTQQAEELWIAAYMEVFDIDARDRHLVPSPYYDSTDLASNPDLAAFTIRLMDRISENPATAIPLRTYITANAALNRDRSNERERLWDHFRTREAQLIARNRAQREAAIRELDIEYDARQLRLNMELESALESRQQSESGNHATPQDGVGTIPRNTVAPSNMSGTVSPVEPRVFSSHLPSSQSSGLPSSRPANLPNSSANSDPGSLWWPITNDSLHEDIVQSWPSSTNAYNFGNDAFLDQTLPSTPATNSRIATLPTDVVHTHANDTIDVLGAALPPVNNARDAPNSRFELSPDSGYGSSYTPCGGCGIICYMQTTCDSCADMLNSRPYF